MNERALFLRLELGLLVLSALVAVVLSLITAPYGRHQRRGFGPFLDGTLGWVLMELAAVVLPIACFVAGRRSAAPVAIALLALWEIHYLQRTFRFPFLRRGGGRMAVVVMGSGILFNILNGYLNGRWLFKFAPVYSTAWLWDPRFIVGVVLFFLGMALNLHSDSVLRQLRRPGESGYGIPRGGLYRFISCPNYLGEIIEWIGWALAAWSPPGALFALWTCANLIPRAVAHHRWYRARFSDYPVERTAIIPFLL